MNANSNVAPIIQRNDKFNVAPKVISNVVPKVQRNAIYNVVTK